MVNSAEFGINFIAVPLQSVFSNCGRKLNGRFSHKKDFSISGSALAFFMQKTGEGTRGYFI